MAVTMQEACRCDAAGAVHEAALYTQPFGFSPAAISLPVHFWWGSNDRAVTYPHPKALEGLPNAVPHYKMGEGHLSIYLRYLEAALQTLSAP